MTGEQQKRSRSCLREIKHSSEESGKSATQKNKASMDASKFLGIMILIKTSVRIYKEFT